MDIIKIVDKFYGDVSLQYMRKSGKILSSVFEYIFPFIKPGISTLDLEMEIRKYIDASEGCSSFYGYNGFPSYACISVNYDVVHAVPKETVILKEGDLITLDMGISYRNHCSDAAKTYVVGGGIHKLIEVADKALNAAINIVKDGVNTGKIGYEIQKAIELSGYFTCTMLGGHGIGLKPHLPPFVPNYGCEGDTISKGMYIAIEPLVFTKHPKIAVRDDGWSVFTSNNCLSAHSETTMAVLEDRAEVLVVF